MKPAPFDYHRAESLEHALELLGNCGEDARVLAGGQSLVPMMNLRLARPSVLIDIGRLGLGDIHVAGRRITLGALTRHAWLLSDQAVATAAPIVPEAIAHIAHPTIRNRGTAGGSVAHADPTAELSALLLLLDGEVEAHSTAGVRNIPAQDFFLSALETALGPTEMITALHLRLPTGSWGGSFQEIAERSGDYAIAAVGCWLRVEDMRIREARVVLSGAETIPRRANAAESVLTDQHLSAELLREAGRAAVAGIEPLEDLRASAAYRRHLLATLTEDAVRAAHDGVGRAS